MTEKTGWVKLDLEAYKKLVAESKDDKEFRKALKEGKADVGRTSEKQ